METVQKRVHKLLDWFSVWRNQPFSSILDFLDLCNVCIWYVHPCILPVYLGVSLFLNLYYLSKKKFIYTPKDACRERLLPWSKQLNWHPCLHHQLQLWNHGYLDVLLWLRNQGSNFLLSVFTYTAYWIMPKRTTLYWI